MAGEDGGEWFGGGMRSERGSRVCGCAGGRDRES